MYYRRDVFEAAGLPSEPEKVSELVATWDDYFNTCQTIKEKTGDYCFSHNKANNNARLFEIALWEQGLGYYNVDTGELTVSSDENVKTLEMLGRFWDADLTSDTQAWTDPWYAELGQTDEGKPVATIIEASWMEGLLKGWIAPGTAGKWGVAEMPSMTPDGLRTANDGGSGFIIPSQTQNPEAAWAFVEFILGRKESQVKMFAASGLIPSLETTYDDPIFQEGDPFLAGQVARAIYVEKVKQIPRAGIYGPDYRMMNEVAFQGIQKYATGEMEARQALKEAEEEIRANLE
jgi:ABC-type glycerol-3-phosphate transport system substrate-binding protein